MNRLFGEKQLETFGRRYVDILTEELKRAGKVASGRLIDSLDYRIVREANAIQIIIQSIGRALRLHSDKEKAMIFDLVDVFDTTDFGNMHYSHFKERKKFYDKREYPHKIIKINL